MISLAKSSFLGLFRPEMNTEKGVDIYMYLTYLQNVTNSKYIWVHGSNFLGASVVF